MALFACDLCNSIENTALGAYSMRRHHERYYGIPNGTALCSACMPMYFLDGSRHSKATGEWHGVFSRDYWTPDCGVEVCNRPKE